MNIFYKTEYNSPLGKLTLLSDGKSLTGLYIEGQKYFNCPNDAINPFFAPNDAGTKAAAALFKKVEAWLNEYFKGKNPKVSSLPLAPKGSEFRQDIWKILSEIPYGKTTTYGEIADKIAKKREVLKMSAQAVGGAIGHNPISIIIPCHRVVGKNGALTGYAGGIENKIKLLQLEGIKTS